MDHFSFFELEPAFRIDQDALRSKFLTNTRSFHPDFAKAKGMDPVEAIEKSTENNRAYKVLSDDMSRTAYLLELKGFLGKSKEQLPPDFLMEMMEMNEGLAELKFEPNSEGIEQVRSTYNEWKKSIDTGLSEMQAKYDETKDEGLLEEVKIFYLKNKYLLRIKESIDTFAGL